MTLGCDDGFISRWTRAYAADGLAGLVSHHPGRAPLRPVAELEARVLDRTLASKPRDGSTHWSSRKLAAELGDVSFSAVQRIWRKHGVRPHRLDTHMIWDDPDFEAKAAKVIGLYLQPPEHASHQHAPLPLSVLKSRPDAPASTTCRIRLTAYKPPSAQLKKRSSSNCVKACSCPWMTWSLSPKNSFAQRLHAPA